jgi:hypothetical protein
MTDADTKKEIAGIHLREFECLDLITLRRKTIMLLKIHRFRVQHFTTLRVS